MGKRRLNKNIQCKPGLMLIYESPGSEVAYNIKSRMTSDIWPDTLPWYWLCYLTLFITSWLCFPSGVIENNDVKICCTLSRCGEKSFYI